MAPPKGNVPRIKQKILECEAEERPDQGGAPGGKYLKDMLRATAYYQKQDMQKMHDDLALFVADK